ncbi:MAG: hypothetical protein LBR76_02495 [Oscillospiraceae bacterium]|jgi:hypothetical protein|nr:hypothetical protein [Oscillospiraceae bacterium]
MIALKPNERLIFAGNAALRAPDGTPLPAVPQFMVVQADEADPASVIQVGENERLILAGHMLTDRKRAEERYAALKAGKEAPPPEIGTPLYMIADKDGFNANEEEQNAINADIAKDIARLFGLHMRRIEMENRKNAPAEA